MKQIVLLFIFLVGCNNQPGYFPVGVFDDRANLDSFIQGWYSYHLSSLKEPSLKNSSGALVFRFTWLRTFHSPMAFRITESSGGQYELIVKRTDGAGGYESGKLIDNETIAIAPEDASSLIAKLENECRFWSQPTQDDASGLDGSQWIFEGNKKENYHVVDRWSPDAGCLRDVGLKFMELSEVEISNVY